MVQIQKAQKRAVLIYWKNRTGNVIELFSNLKNLCLSYPQYNYNTLNNYLSKNKIAYENEEVKIERKTIHSRPVVQRSMVAVVIRRQLKDLDEKEHDLDYWLQQPPRERLQAATFIVSQSLKKEQRMDKNIVHKKKRKYVAG